MDMTSRIANGALTAAASNLVMKGLMEQMNDFLCEQIGSADESLLTISAGVVTPAARTGGIFQIETEGAASSDTLSIMTPTNMGSHIACLRAYNASHVVTIEHGAGSTGEFLLADGLDLVLNSTSIRVWFMLIGTSWVEFYRTYGSDFAAQREYFRIPHITPQGILDPFTRLHVEYTSASSLTLTADSLVLRDSSGRQKEFTSVSEVLTISTTGAGGRVAAENFGNEKASDWYHVWLIGKDDGTINLFASLAAFPGGADIFALLPSGYTYAGYYSAVYNNDSSNFNDFWQDGLEVSGTLVNVLTAGTTTSRTSISLTSAVPDTARKVRGYVQVVPSGAGQQASVTLYGDAGSNTGSMLFVVSSSGAVANDSPFELHIRNSQEMAYAAGSGPDSVTIAIAGFRFL